MEEREGLAASSVVGMTSKMVGDVRACRGDGIGLGLLRGIVVEKTGEEREYLEGEREGGSCRRSMFSCGVAGGRETSAVGGEMGRGAREEKRMTLIGFRGVCSSGEERQRIIL